MSLKILILILAAVFVICGWPYRLDLRVDEIVSKKIRKQVKICVLSDLHCRPYGKNHSWIMKLVNEQNPDMVVIPGDLFDTGRNYEVSFDLLRALKGRTVYFSSGNHDNYLEEMDEFRRRMREMGVHVLENSSEIFNEDIEIAGLSDAGRTPALTPEEVCNLTRTDRYRILISHRPNHLDLYRAVDYDLIICGHAHGGQWRIPFTKQGIAGPQQGLFPKYTDGIHDMNGSLMYISRGLASGDGRIPRLYNNPEVGIIIMKGEEQS